MHSRNMHVRRALPADAKRLAELCSLTFFETYSSSRPRLKREFIAYTKKHYSLKRVLNNLLNHRVVYFIVEKGKYIIGYCKINLYNAPSGRLNKNYIHLEEIYLRKNYIAQGLGKRLLKKFLWFAAKEQARFVWLGVWEGNKKAIDFYKKFGFRVFGRQDFLINKTSDIDLLMKLKIF